MDLFPEEPPTTRYSPAFEQCWSVHRVGVKKAAWNAGKKAGWTDAHWTWLRDYLERRHREDAKWKEGYVLHLSTIINQERWTDEYPRIKKDRYDRAEEQRRDSASPEAMNAAGQAELQRLRDMGVLH